MWTLGRVRPCPMSADGWVSASRRTPLADRAPPRSGGRGGMDPKMAKQLQELQSPSDGGIRPADLGAEKGLGKKGLSGARPEPRHAASPSQEGRRPPRVTRGDAEDRGDVPEAWERAHASRADRPGSVRGLEGEHQAGASDLEGGAHAGAAEAAETPEITGVECQWVRAAPGDASEPCMELRLPHQADGEWQAVADPRGDR